MSGQYWEVGGGGCGDPSFELCGHQFLSPEPQGPFHGSYICIRVAKCFTTKSRNLKAVFCALCMQFLLPGENRCLHRCEAGQRTMARARPILCWPLHRNSSCGHRTHFCTFAIRKATSPTMKMSQQAIPPLPPHVFFPEDPINFRPIQACPSASPMLCLKIFDLSERWEN